MYEKYSYSYHGPIGNDAQKAIEEIEQEGKYTGRIALYDMRFLKPIDENILEEVGKNFSEIITIEDGVINGGLGTTVIEWLNEHNKNIHVQRLGLPDHFIDKELLPNFVNCVDLINTA